VDVPLALYAAIFVSATCCNIPTVVVKVAEYLWSLYLQRRKERLILNIVKQPKRYFIFRFRNTKSSHVCNVLARGAVSMCSYTHQYCEH
jgi:hypothetical protein